MRPSADGFPTRIYHQHWKFRWDGVEVQQKGLAKVHGACLLRELEHRMRAEDSRQNVLIVYFMHLRFARTLHMFPRLEREFVYAPFMHAGSFLCPPAAEAPSKELITYDFHIIGARSLFLYSTGSLK